MNLEKRVEGWNKLLTRILGIPWGFLIGAELTIAQSRISLVNKIQKEPYEMKISCTILKQRFIESNDDRNGCRLNPKEIMQKLY
ncbi:hypothetical protein G4B88_014418 [Cannabis sativa]|uniref:Uncharacterized protein n=1 Tax=Cannabis sativa TaxID=3483 RepID=A0A7J6I8N5_CANSA|nr:hypothetical protein G4B88_014418 [Cannabis sativa]